MLPNVKIVPFAAFFFSPPTHWRENLPVSASGVSFNLMFNGKAEFMLVPAEQSRLQLFTSKNIGIPA